MKHKRALPVFKIAIISLVIVAIATTSYINSSNKLHGIKSRKLTPSQEYADIRKLETEKGVETPTPPKQKNTSSTRQSLKESKDNAKFGVKLNTQGTGSGRVLQNFAFDESSGEIYTVQDESNSNNNLLINKLTSDGKSLGNITLTNFGHGNGLGLERLPDNSIRLWTDYIPVDSHGYGTKVVRFNFDNPSESTSYDLCPPGYKVPFVSIENESRTVLMRAVHKKTKDERMFVFPLDKVLEGATSPKFSFSIDPVQQAQSFQGLHAKDNVIYVLTGDSSIYTPKLLYGYGLSGKVLFKKKVSAGIVFAANNGGYYEPEGLYVCKDPNTGKRRVYVGIVTGQTNNSKNISKDKNNRLYYYEDY